MKEKFNKLLIIIAFSLSLAASGSFAASHHHHHNSGNWSIFFGSYPASYNTYYSEPYYYEPVRYCRVIQGHFNYSGFWVPPQRVCWYQ